MKPRADDDDVYPTYLGTGVLGQLSEPDHDDEVAGKLIVPDPEARHRWREVCVRRPSARPVARQIGFRPR